MKSVVLLILGLLSVPAYASDVTPKDVQIIGRILGFMENPGPQPLDLGIVYVRNNVDSLRQADAMCALLVEVPVVGKVSLRPHMVAANDLATQDHSNALFIVPAAIAAAAQAAAAAQRLHIPVISTDPACVKAGDCVLSFSSSPTVEIILNRSSAETAGVRFTAAFRMLVKQI